MADLDFYHLQDNYKYIIEEGYFHVPEKVIKDIKNFYIENIKKYINNGEGRVTRREYPPKDFHLDFTGTNFEFLNFRNPSVTIYLTSKRSYYYDYNHHGEDTMETFNHGNIYLQLKSTAFRRILTDVIEHEVMHYIQSLMNSLHNNYPSGFPNRNLWRQDVDVHGYLNDGSRSHRVPHSQRPMEYYPDLLTSIRELFQNYHDKIKRNPHYDILKNNEKAKRYFFTDFINAVNNNEYIEGFFNKGLTVDIFREFKKVSPEFYNKILKIAYNAFVNGEPNFDPKELGKQLRMIQINGAFGRIQDNK
jgi:hypothetical protein